MRDTPTSPLAVPPPIAFFGGAFCALGLQVLWPLRTSLAPSLGKALGIGVLVASAVLGFWGIRSMFLAGESPDPAVPTSKLVTGGPFAYSRNPIYLSFALFDAGLGFLFNNLWLFIVLLPMLLYVDRLIVGREEWYLERRLGEEYLDYKRRVRRWL